MINITYYKSPIGKLTLASNENKLIGLWIENQKYHSEIIKNELNTFKSDEILIKTKKWLDRYFNGDKPHINELNIEMNGSDFRKSVYKRICKIPYGKIITYNDIAKDIAKEKGITKMSAQAVGNAVGHNPISIIVPCHRVVGCNGKLTGYAGGIEKKIFLLKNENFSINNTSKNIIVYKLENNIKV